jgi:hypothetical protein
MASPAARFILCRPWFEDMCLCGAQLRFLMTEIWLKLAAEFDAPEQQSE